MTKREKRIPWQSQITEVRPNELRTHGVNQIDIIRSFSYEEMVFFLLTGRRPNDVEKELLRAIIVSHISHGITGQSTLAVMMAADCRSDFLHALVAGFSTGAGIYHQGGLNATMQELQRLDKLSYPDLMAHVQKSLKEGKRIIGFGHRFHKVDPRARTLIAIAEELGHNGRHFQMILHIEKILRQEKGISLNIEGVGGAILLDLGFNPEIAHLIIIIGRSPMYAAVYLERLAQGRAPFQKIEVLDVVEIEEG